MDNLELALDDCLQQLAAGKSSLGQCLARYPQYAAELRPLLETALRLQQGKQVRPSGAMRDRARFRLAKHIDLHPRRRVPAVPRLAIGFAALALALMAVTTAFAQAALPGQTLYALKLSTERAWRAASPDPVAVDLSLADRRADELIQLTHQRNQDVSSKHDESLGIAAYNDVLTRLSSESSGAKGADVLTALENHQKKLLDAGIHVPELDDIVSHGKSGNGQSPPKKP
jgi:hypothetical protein